MRISDWSSDVCSSDLGRLSVFATRHKLQFLTGQRPWGVPADIALPCATQNELDDHDARQLVANKVKCVAEGANMPSTLEAVDVFLDSGVLSAPGKASNAGAVATGSADRRGGTERGSTLSFPVSP